MLLFFLQACTLDYAGEKTEQFARTIGVVNHFKISRWHARLLSQNSRLWVATNKSSLHNAGVLTSSFTQGLGQFFEKVSASEHSLSESSAIQSVKSHNADFLFYLELIAAEPAPQTDKSGQGAVSQRFSSLSLMITVIDANSARVIDKILMESEKSLIDFIDNDVSSILREPIHKLGRDLTGV